MRILVTGGGGFIASHIGTRLLHERHDVRVLDNFSTGSRANLDHVVAEIDLIEGDIQSYERVRRAVCGCDIVLHQAALASVPRSVQDPLTSNATNLIGTLNVLLAARDQRVRRVVFAGPRQTGPYGIVVRNFVRQALPPRSSPSSATAPSSAASCRVSDVVRALADLMVRDDVYGEVFNSGSTEEISIRELAERVRAHTASESEIQLIPYDEACEAGFEDMVRRVPDLTKIRRVSGWAPTRQLDDILTDVVERQRAGAHP